MIEILVVGIATYIPLAILGLNYAATLSFFGLGAEPGYADWGQMISRARNWVVMPPGSPFKYWYTIVFPGAALLLFSLSWNLVGDAFRDIYDPRLRGK